MKYVDTRQIQSALGMETGLGDIINAICSIQHTDVNVVTYPEDTKHPLFVDLIRHREGIRLGEKRGENIGGECVRAIRNPRAKTTLAFSEEELEMARYLLAQIELPSDYIVVTANQPRFPEQKELSVEEWIGFVKECGGDLPVVLAPTYRSDRMDLHLQRLLEWEGLSVVNLETELIAERAELIEKTQPVFGVHRRKGMMSIRQNAATYAVLLTRRLQGLFQDSAPVHLAAAATGLGMLVDKCVHPNYIPRNGGRVRSYLYYDYEKKEM